MMAAGSPSGIVALGYRRSLIELRNNLGSLPGHLMFPVIAVVTISIVRHSDALAGRGGSFGNYALIGILLINTLLSGVMGAASTVMQERMDGTLLRSSCLPHGTTAYAISKVLSHFQLAVTAFAVALPLLWLVMGRTALSPMSTAVLLVVAPAGLLSLPTFWVSASLRNALLPESSHSGDPSDLTVLVGGLIVPLIWLVIGISLARRALRRASRCSGGRRGSARHKACEGGRRARRTSPQNPRAAGARARHQAATRRRRRSTTQKRQRSIAR